MPPQDLPTLPFDKHGHWFVTAHIIPYPSEPVQWRIFIVRKAPPSSLHLSHRSLPVPHPLPQTSTTSFATPFAENPAQLRQLTPNAPTIEYTPISTIRASTPLYIQSLTQNVLFGLMVYGEVRDLQVYNANSKGTFMQSQNQSPSNHVNLPTQPFSPTGPKEVG